MFKSKIRGITQEVILPDFSDDENTVNTTTTKSRRVSFGTNFVKEFMVGSSVSAQCVSEYEQAFSSSDSSNPNSSHSAVESGILNQNTFTIEDNKKCYQPASSVHALEADGFDNLTKRPKFSSTICFSADSPTADMEFTEGCITLAKTILDKKNKEITVIIQAKSKTEKEEAQTNEENTKFFEGSQLDVSVPNCFKARENRKDEKRFEEEKTKILVDDMSITKCDNIIHDMKYSHDDSNSNESFKENQIPLEMIMRHLDNDNSDLENSLFHPEKSLNDVLNNNPFDASIESEKVNMDESMDITKDLQPNILKELTTFQKFNNCMRESKDVIEGSEEMEMDMEIDSAHIDEISLNFRKSSLDGMEKVNNYKEAATVELPTTPMQDIKEKNGLQGLVLTIHEEHKDRALISLSVINPGETKELRKEVVRHEELQTNLFKKSSQESDDVNLESTECDVEPYPFYENQNIVHHNESQTHENNDNKNEADHISKLSFSSLNQKELECNGKLIIHSPAVPNQGNQVIEEDGCHIEKNEMLGVHFEKFIIHSDVLEKGNLMDHEECSGLIGCADLSLEKPRTSKNSELEKKIISNLGQKNKKKLNEEFNMTVRKTEELHESKKEIIHSPPSLDDVKVIEDLENQSKESGCIWSLSSVEYIPEKNTGVWSINFKLLDSISVLKLLLEVSEQDSTDSLYSCSNVKASEIYLTQTENHYRNEYQLILEFGCLQQKKYLEKQQKLVKTILHIPYFLDQMNSFTTKLNSHLEQIYTILTHYPGSRFKDSILSFRLFSFPILFSATVFIDLTDFYQLSKSSLSFEKDFGNIDENKIRYIFEKCLTIERPLFEFVVKSNKFLIDIERKSGIMSKRNHIRLFPQDFYL